MTILGIDYGRKKMGLAVADGSLAEPLQVIHYDDTSEMFAKLVRILDEVSPEKIIVGMSEGNMAREITNFIDTLREKVMVPVEEHDETLTSRDAQTLSQMAGKSRKDRKNMEDAYAAALMLQDYLDTRL